MAAWHLPPELVRWVTQLTLPLHAGLADRLLPLLTGLLFARGRRTVASWLRGGGLGHDDRSYYYFLTSLGHKVKYVAGQVSLVHSVDSVALAEVIEARGVPQACLVQVNVAGEASKHGVAPAALGALLDRFAAFAHLRCAGLMLIPPLGPSPEAARPHFAALRALRDAERAGARPNVDLAELSMGMSDDFEVAIAEGATLVRVGTAIFGRR